MAREFAISFYHSPDWKRARAAYMAIPVDTPYGTVPPYMCERCYSMGRLKPAKVVHHKVHVEPWNVENPEVTLDFANFERLCQDCHAAVHGRGDESPVAGRVAFGPGGEVLRADR